MKGRRKGGREGGREIRREGEQGTMQLSSWVYCTIILPLPPRASKHHSFCDLQATGWKVGEMYARWNCL